MLYYVNNISNLLAIHLREASLQELVFMVCVIVTLVKMNKYYKLQHDISIFHVGSVSVVQSARRGGWYTKDVEMQEEFVPMLLVAICPA